MNGRTRTGIGFDIHPLVVGRRLVLGGVEVPFEKGLEGWSDADVLAHAIIDALLGAAALGDIGSHFPPGAPEYRGISSLVLLKKAVAGVAEKGFLIDNIDATVIAERPRLRDFIDRMRAALSEAMGIGMEQVSVKASTTNGVGGIAQGEGIAAIAVAQVRGT